jgi:hypothetical protein
LHRKIAAADPLQRVQQLAAIEDHLSDDRLGGRRGTTLGGSLHD